ncbi:hypothetical protein [Nitrososphaera viennensis]|uniref:DUF4430 domain-containing protein n=2 Tax=Nitrososphaera viennensis TaxID=1034015 RepID=A0A060HHE2_9ARCH|nr:hypothetical protein [Nitrososphaera viennensis]AIC14770.1 hypothetical protein NVIE_005700 [Nitrososphaera viennensis EN76]UVS69726.1 hypothetical protein NWT39_02810 [Nitrososphaera viennensis]
MGFGGQEPGKKRRLMWSMALLAGVVIVAGVGTKAVTDYLRSQDPIYQCIENPLAEPYQLTVPVSATVDGAPARIPSGVGITDSCTLPVHTLQENTIHVAYGEPYAFTLGHFLYNWIGQDLTKYDTKVYVNGVLHTNGSFLDIPLKNGDSIRIEFTTRK